jgi:kinesin family protein 4/21/27
MLGQCARQLVDARRKGGAKAVKAFSMRAFVGDLVPLLSESMMGDAATACFVCLSQAPDNLTQSKYALDFGEVFAKLCLQPRRVTPAPRKKIEKEASALLQEATKVLSTPSGGGKMMMVRVAQKYDCEQVLALMERLW